MIKHWIIAWGNLMQLGTAMALTTDYRVLASMDADSAGFCLRTYVCWLVLQTMALPRP